MRKYLLFIALTAGCSNAIAQSSTSETTSSTIKSLSVPVSPAFSITDITPTLVQNPTTPKAFALGVAQSATAGSSYFPDNYSAQFAPIWWIDPSGISIYSSLGLAAPKDKEKLDETKQNIFSGLKFSTLSIGFVNKDMIPDNLEKNQKIFSIGVHSTLVKVYGKEHTKHLNNAINDWHKHALEDIKTNQHYIDAIARLDATAPDYQAQVDAITKDITVKLSSPDLKIINKLIIEKPVFAWDFSTAIAGYSISSEEVKTGRASVWTDLSLNLKLDKNATNYFSINALGRYLYDRYQANDEGIVGRANNIDAGGNLGFELNRLNIAVESLYRFTNGVANSKNRTVGILSVKVTDNIFINGTFGKDFSGPNKLISIFGINWGFGEEKIKLP
jgi:hypothetical protein